MKRIDLYVTHPQFEEMKRASSETELSMSEIVRRLLDKWIEAQRTVSAK
jgi:hypothetical protein